MKYFTFYPLNLRFNIFNIISHKYYTKTILQNITNYFTDEKLSSQPLAGYVLRNKRINCQRQWCTRRKYLLRYPFLSLCVKVARWRMTMEAPGVMRKKGEELNSSTCCPEESSHAFSPSHFGRSVGWDPVSERVAGRKHRNIASLLIIAA